MTPFPQAAPAYPTDGLCLLKLPARASGYEVAQIVWQVGAGFPLVALETLLRTPVRADGGTLAERLESSGVFAQAGRTHLAAYLQVRGPAEAVRGVIGEIARALAVAEPAPQAVRTAVGRVSGAVEKSGLVLATRADRALHAAFAGPASRFGEHPEGPAAAVRALGPEQVADALAALRRAPVSVLYCDPAAADEWTRAVAPLSVSGPELRVSADGDGDGLSDGLAEPGFAVAADGVGEVRVALPGLRGAHVLWGFVAEVGKPGAADGLIDHVAAEVAAHALGGWWQARWQQLFREELNATYGTRTRAEAFRVGERTYSLALVGMTLGAVDRAAVVRSLRAQAARFVAEGLTADESRSSAAQLARAEALHAESARALSTRMAQPLLQGLDPGFPRVRLDYLANDPDPADVASRVRALVVPSVIVVAEGEES